MKQTKKNSIADTYKTTGGKMIKKTKKLQTTELEKQIRNVNTKHFDRSAYEMKTRILKVVRKYVTENYPFIK